jgi:hypothetical protein
MIREGYLRNNYKRKISLCYPDALETGYCGALVIGKQRIKSITILDDNDTYYKGIKKFYNKLGKRCIVELH